MDLSILSTVSKPEAISPADYVAPLDYSDPIKDVGDYKVRVIDGKFKDKEVGGEDPFRLSKTKSGFLQVEVALEVTEGTYKGKRLYDRWNQVPFSSNPKSNSMSNALFGFGFTGNLVNPEDYLKALDQLIKKGAVSTAYVSLEWYSNPNAKDYQGTGNTYKYKDYVGSDKVQPDGIRFKEDNGTILLARNVLGKFRQ